MKALIVCSANMCRSPMAHAILEELARKRGLTELQVRSAGTMGFQRAPALDKAIAVCLEHGLSLEQFESSALTRELIEDADLVVVMEDAHFSRVQVLMDGQLLAGKLYYLSEFHPDKSLPREIPDPVSRGIEHFRHCFDVLEACLGGVVDSVVLHP